MGSTVWRRVIAGSGVFALGVVGNLASDALKDTFPWIVAVIWPLVIIGITVIVVALIQVESRRPTAVAPQAGSLDPPDDQKAARYAELEERERRRQVGMLLNLLDQEIQKARDIATNYGPSGSNDLNHGWGEVQRLDGRVDRILSDAHWPQEGPKDREDYNRNIDSLLSDVAGRERIDRYVTIKRELMETIRSNRQHAGD